MARSKYMVSASVFNSDKFAALSHSAQALYPQILVTTDTNGGASGVGRVMRMGGFDDSNLRELEDAGLVFRVESDDGPVLFVTDYFVHNITNAEKLKNGEHYYLACDSLAVSLKTRRLCPIEDLIEDQGEPRLADGWAPYLEGLATLSAKHDTASKKRNANPLSYTSPERAEENPLEGLGWNTDEAFGAAYLEDTGH